MTPQRGPGTLRWIALLVVGVLIGMVAGRYVIDRPTVAAETPAPRLAFRVYEGTLSRTLRLPATGAWEVAGTIRSPAAGVITAVEAANGLVDPGAVLLRIDERPVMLIPGSVPAFRELRVGTRGRDVAALQRYLGSLGYETDRRVSRFTKTTREAVRRWQDALGLPESGVIALGDVVFVPEEVLGAPLRWTDAVAVGATVAAGEPILEQLEAVAKLTIDFGGSVPPQLEPGVPAEVVFPDGTRTMASLSSIHREEGRNWATLDPIDEAWCGGAGCIDLVLLDGETPLDVTFALVPETTGPLVPVAAVQSDAAGRAFVELSDGSRRTVSVRVASGGSAIVDGVSAGDEILLP